MTLPRLVGMIHLPPMPGSPGWQGDTQREIMDAACRDAVVLEESGFDAVLVQNSLDRPTRERVDQLTIAQLAAVTTVVSRSVSIDVGVNVVKNDGPAAVAIAACAEAAFVRVKVLTGAVLSAEGIVEGCAAATHELRTRAGHPMQVWADIYEPTSRQLLADDFDHAITDAMDFGLADAVIVTGTTASDSIRLAEKASALKCPVVIGGRISAETVKDALQHAESVIVGSALKADPGIRGRVDGAKARTIVAAADGRISASA